MSAYSIVEIDEHYPAGYEKYKKQAHATVFAHGMIQAETATPRSFWRRSLRRLALMLLHYREHNGVVSGTKVFEEHRVGERSRWPESH